MEGTFPVEAACAGMLSTFATKQVVAARSRNPRTENSRNDPLLRGSQDHKSALALRGGKADFLPMICRSAG